MPSTYMPLEHADLEKYHDQLPEDFRSSRKNDRTGRRVDCALYDPTEAVGA